MSEVEDDDQPHLDVQVEMPPPVILGDGDVCVPDMDALHPDAEAEGVLAVWLQGNTLFYLDGATRQWVDVQQLTVPKRGRVKSFN